MNFKHIFFILFGLISLSSCSKWIDVKPNDRLAEDVLFEDASGYLKALNGVYVELAHDDLYGRFMTASALDAMAHYYYISATGTSVPLYQDYAAYGYTEAHIKYGFDAAWQKAYTLIANLNVIIEKCADAPSAALPEPYYAVVKGEALGLRAMLHFDMLRLFGPIWSETTKEKPCIPYAMTAHNEISPLSSSEQVMAYIEADLSEALDLLQETDPIRTEGINNGPGADNRNDFTYRQYRFNYFAVKALMARTALWKGDKVKALRYAEEVIQEAQVGDEAIFPFVTLTAVNDIERPDRVFSTEVIFSLYNINRVKTYNEVFSASLESDMRLSMNAMNEDMSRVNAMYDNSNDYRLKAWEIENAPVSGSMVTNNKFKDYVDAPGRYMVPLIRISELYLIAAECSDNLEKASGYVNTLRHNRNVQDLTPAGFPELADLIKAEYRREFLGEGQLFFYYKRCGLQNIPSYSQLTGDQTISLTNYQVPLPDSEIRWRAAE